MQTLVALAGGALIVLLGAMMKIRLGAGGAKAAAPEAITADQDAAAEPEWIRWNNARDTGTDAEKSD
jgi:hypothetical protein